MNQKITKSIFITLAYLLINTFVFGQAPQKMSYQAVIRNNQNALVSNQAVGMRVSVLQGSASGTAVYVETHTPTTNVNGLASIEIGGGTILSGTFAGINWANGPFFVKTETDPTGGSNYSISGTSQLLSVPYALFAGNVANNGGKQTLVLSDDVTDVQAASIIAAEVGPNTQEIRIVGTTQLTSVDLSMIQTAIDINIANNSALTTVNLSGLKRMDGDLRFENCPVLNSINLSALQKITTGILRFSKTALSSVSLPGLIKCNGSISISSNSKLTSIAFNLSTLNSLSIGLNPILTSVNFSSLVSVYYEFTISNNNSLANISFPSLTQSNNVSINQNNSLTNISFNSLIQSDISLMNNQLLNNVNFPALVKSNSMSISQNNSLSSLVFSSLTSIGDNVSSTSSSITFYGNSINNNPFPALSAIGSSISSISLSSNKLSSTAVNTILNKLANISPLFMGKNIYLQGQTPAAPPTGQGITDKNTLIANGNNVYTD